MYLKGNDRCLFQRIIPVFAGGCEDNNENPQSEKLVSMTRIEMGTSRIQVRSVTA
jgi:hypothetical protein